MKKEFVILSLSLLLINLVCANSVTFNETSITGDVSLNKGSVPDDYYSFVTFDLNDYFNNYSIDKYTIKANLSLVLISYGGSLTSNVSNISIELLPNQSINLSSIGEAKLFNEVKSSKTFYKFEDISSNKRFEIPLDNLVKNSILNGNRYLTIRIQSLDSVLFPDTKVDSTEIEIGNDSNFLRFGSSTQNSLNDYKPKLNIFYNATNNSNIQVQPNEFRFLPQIFSPVPLVTTGLNRTYLFCTWKIGNQGETTIRMNGTACPIERQNFTFIDDKKYFVSIDYSNIYYNLSTKNWVVINTNNSINLTQIYKVDLPEPSESLFNSIINTIKGWINNILCGLFGIGCSI